jgi:hypothetical protein
MTECLFEYLHGRLVNFDKYQASSKDFQITENLFQSMMCAFQSRIFCQNRSSFAQYIPLYVMAHAYMTELQPDTRQACLQFQQ